MRRLARADRGEIMGGQLARHVRPVKHRPLHPRVSVNGQHLSLEQLTEPNGPAIHRNIHRIDRAGHGPQWPSVLIARGSESRRINSRSTTRVIRRTTPGRNEVNGGSATPQGGRHCWPIPERILRDHGNAVTLPRTQTRRPVPSMILIPGRHTRYRQCLFAWVTLHPPATLSFIQPRPPRSYTVHRCV